MCDKSPAIGIVDNTIAIVNHKINELSTLKIFVFILKGSFTFPMRPLQDMSCGLTKHSGARRGQSLPRV